ncbi:MAG: hypothetical protein KJ063_20300 [Anaerolineae bacterium]|nr:hypothetical protein [Anaerolineae bacterium]
MKALAVINKRLERIPTAWPTAVLLLALTLAIVPAALPYFGFGLPRTNDAFPHLFRVVALDQMVREGVWWPRWSPHLVHGYGYPVFNFFPSLSHWVVELFHLMGVPLTMAYRLTVLLQAAAAAWGMFFLGRAMLNAAAGWIAALAYVYSPYLLYDSIIRGGLPEAQALALFPWLLLAIWQMIRKSEQTGDNGNRKSEDTLSLSLLLSRSFAQRGWFVAAAFIAAAMLLSHPIVYPIFLFIGLWLLRLTWRHGWHILPGPAIALGLGVLLTAFFLLPALGELEATRALTAADQDYSYLGNFLSLGQLLTFPQLPADPALINPPVVRAIPLFVLLWAGFRLAWRWPGLPQTRRPQIIDWVLLCLLAIWLITPSSRFVWDNVPLLPQILYPWRFLGLASLAAALLLAHSFLADEAAGWPRWPLLTLISLGILLTAIPWLYPPREPISENPGLIDLAAFEAPPLFIGTTTLGEFLPRWVQTMPDTTELRQQLIDQGDPDRLSPTDGLQVIQRTGPTTNAVYHVRVTAPVRVSYRQFYFPGWQARLNGEAIPLSPSEPEGVLQLELPPGDHELHLFFGSTPLRRWGAGISWAAAAFALFIWGLPARHRVAAAATPSPQTEAPLGRPFLLLATGLLLTYTFFTLVDTPLRRATLQPDGIVGRPRITPLDYAGEIQLLSYEQSAYNIAAADPIQLTLYWRPLRPIGVTYDVGVQIVDSQGVIWSQWETTRPYNWRFISGNDPWPLDSYRMDPFVVRLLDGTPPGDYFFHVGLVRRETQETIAAHTLGLITVTTAAKEEQPLEEGMIPAAAAPPTEGIRLLGTRLDRREAFPGDPLRLTMLWLLTDPPIILGQGELTLQLVNETGEVIWSQNIPLAPTYPRGRWQAGDRLRTEHLLRLPAWLPTGEYQWRVGAAATDRPVYPVGPLRLNPIDRLWHPPVWANSHNDTLGNVATFLGANITPAAWQPGTPLQVQLAWRSEAETDESYRVFLHLIGPNGEVVTQSDGEPVQWTRPTTGWLPGEIIIDEHILWLPPTLPPGEYQLLTGLYHPETSQRLALPGGRTAVLITTFTANHVDFPGE